MRPTNTPPRTESIVQAGARPPPCRNRSGEDLRLLGRELLVGEHSLCLQVRQILQLVDRVDRRSGGSRGWWRRVLLLRPPRRPPLSAPLPLLAVPHAARHG